MRNRFPAPSIPALGLLLLAVLSSAAVAQDNLEGKVAQLLERADAGELNAVWALSYELTGLAGVEDGKEDTLARVIARGTERSHERGRLAAARALIELGEGTAWGKEILTILEPVCDSPEDGARAAAMGLLGTPGAFSRRILEKAQEILDTTTNSELVAPEVRVEAAKSLWKVGTNEQRSAARRTLQQFLQSTNRNLQVLGALALAEINADSSGAGWRILREIQDEPTAEGRLARSYVRLDAERRHFERLFRDRLDKRPAGDDGNERYRRLDEILARIRAQHIRGDEFSDDYLYDAAAKGLMRSLDRHSSFFTQDEFKRFYFDLNREYGGIGAFVNFDRDDIFSIVRPIYSGPAYRAGLRSGDKIFEVDGWETTGHTSEEIISRLKGAPDSKVTIKFYRPGMEEPEDVSIVRQEIQVPSVNKEILPGNIGYVELITFGSNTSSELRAALTEFRRKGVEGVILDVRSNTGGFLLAARDVVEQFIAGEKRVVYTKSRAGIEEEFSTRDRAILPDMPMVVLVNQYSASASEITAGALQDYKRAKIVGKRSYGKGSVQSLIPLASQPSEPFDDANDNGMRDEWETYEDLNHNGEYDLGPRLKLTVARYYLPSGRTPNKEIDEDGKIVDPDWGITPDIEAELVNYSAADAWKVEAVRDLLKRDVFTAYVKEHFDANTDLFERLAEADGCDPSRYPDFDAFYDSLDTKLPRDDVRMWLRYRVRDAVADLRGRAFVGTARLGDFQEDLQLQAALRAVLQATGVSVDDIEDYKAVFKEPAAVKQDGDADTSKDGENKK